jgi:hypothetical protein
VDVERRFFEWLEHVISTDKIWVAKKIFDRKPECKREVDRKQTERNGRCRERNMNVKPEDIHPKCK